VDLAFRAGNPGLTRLTPSERRILRLIASDKTSKEIAAELGLSARTVENHRTNICTKLNLRGIHSLVKFAFENRSRL
jgi:DNA-binding CsgD family transcriptional regulator